MQQLSAKKYLVSLFIFLLFFQMTVLAEHKKTDKENILRTEIRENGLVGTLYLPKNRKNLSLIIALGGSEGGIKSAESYGKSLSKEGFAVLALAYFRMEGLPKELKLIPIEYFEKALKWIKSVNSVNQDKIGIIGGSKGGELALLLASRYPVIKTVAAFVPSSCVFQSINGGYTSSWSYRGKGLPFVPYKMPRGYKFQPGFYTPLYTESLEQTEMVEKAIIEVEKINGPIMLFSGGKDKIWPSEILCNMIVKRLKEKHFKHPVINIFKKDKGHGVAHGPAMKKKWINFFKKYL